MEITNHAASEWSHETLFPSFHVDESHDYFEDYEEETENWKWKQFYSLVLGPCYMFEFTTNVTTKGPYAYLGIKYVLRTVIGKGQIFTEIVTHKCINSSQNSVNPNISKSLKMFIHEPGAEIWLIHASLLLKGQATVFTLPK